MKEFVIIKEFLMFYIYLLILYGKMQRKVDLIPNEHIYNTAPPPKSQETYGKWEKRQ